MNLYDIIDEFKDLGGYEFEEIENRVVQFYTDLIQMDVFKRW